MDERLRRAYRNFKATTDPEERKLLGEVLAQELDRSRGAPVWPWHDMINTAAYINMERGLDPDPTTFELVEVTDEVLARTLTITLYPWTWSCVRCGRTQTHLWAYNYHHHPIQALCSECRLAVAPGLGWTNYWLGHRAAAAPTPPLWGLPEDDEVRETSGATEPRKRSVRVSRNPYDRLS